MANKKIMYVITKASLGGATRYVRDLAVSMRHDFDVVVAAGTGEWLFNECEKENIRTVKLLNAGRNISILKDVYTFFDLLTLFRKERPDIIHLNSSKIGGLGALAGRISGVPKIIFTAHGWAFNEKRSFISKIAFFKLHWLTIFLSHITIANSAHTYKMAPLKKGLRTIYLGIEESVSSNLEREEATLTNLCAQLYNQEDEEKVSVLTIAELHTNKGVDVLLKAIPKTNKNIVFTFIGGGDLERKLKLRAKELAIGHRVCFAGVLENAAQYIGLFDIFVLPSRTESLGYVLLEAGLRGKAVVATNVGGIPEIIEDGKTGILVPKENEKALAEAINSLAADTQKREQLGDALKQFVTQKFSFKKMIGETKMLYMNNSSLL